MIIDYVVTSAPEHDSQPMPGMIDEHDCVVYANSAHWGKIVEEVPPAGVVCQTQECGTKYITITEEQNNRIKSKVAAVLSISLDL